MQKMINSDDILKEKTKQYQQNLPKIYDHAYIISITGGSGFGKTNSLFNLMSHQTDIDKNSLYAKYPYEAKYWLLMILKLLLNI